MTPFLNQAVWGALIVVGPLVVMVIVAASCDRLQNFNDRHDRVVASFSGLRITASHLLVGHCKDTERIPLAGLAVAVRQTESAAGPDVVVTIRGAARVIERREPLSYGTGGQAQIFAVMFNRMARTQCRIAATGNAA